MEKSLLVCMLALLEYIVITGLTGSARGKYGVAAPAVSGNETFERYLRVQQNTVEQLVIFIPALFTFAYLGSDLTAAAIGLVFVIGRGIYAWGYITEPKRRSIGMLLSFFPNIVLVVGALIALVRTQL